MRLLFAHLQFWPDRQRHCQETDKTGAALHLFNMQLFLDASLIIIRCRSQKDLQVTMKKYSRLDCFRECVESKVDIYELKSPTISMASLRTKV